MTPKEIAEYNQYLLLPTLDPLPLCDCDDMAEANLRLRGELAKSFADNLELRARIKRLDKEIERLEIELKRIKANEKNRVWRATRL